jgi:hypothetical protein
MNRARLLRLLLALAAAVLCGWIVSNTAWEEEDVPNPPGKRADDDRFYALRRILKAAGSTLEASGDFEPLPPAGATLALDSSLWDVFPERDERLRRWVEGGGHLVVFGRTVAMQAGDSPPLGWVPLSFRSPHGSVTTPAGQASAPAGGRPAVRPPDGGGADDDEDDDAPASAPRAAIRPVRDARRGGPCPAGNVLALEGDAPPAPLEAGRRYTTCASVGWLRPRTGVRPLWRLVTAHGDTFAVEVAVGRGRVTAVHFTLPTGNRQLLQEDDALLVAAVLHAGPGHAVHVLEDGSRTGFFAWLWRVARGPVLLALVAVAAALWRLAVRFGPRELPPARARRSMGEQVRGMGEFILARDPAALHGAARHALDELARGRIDGYATLDEDQRADALAALLPQAGRAEAAGLRAAMDASPRPTRAHWLAAIETLEQARRALLRTTAIVRAPR